MSGGRSLITVLVVVFLLFAGVDLALRYAATRQSTNPQAEQVVTQELASRDITVKRVLCQSDHTDPKTLPAVEQIVSLHPDEQPKLYQCSVQLPTGENETIDPSQDRGFCVVGFSGQTPWQAIDTPGALGCGALAPRTS